MCKDEGIHKSDDHDDNLHNRQFTPIQTFLKRLDVYDELMSQLTRLLTDSANFEVMQMFQRMTPNYEIALLFLIILSMPTELIT